VIVNDAVAEDRPSPLDFRCVEVGWCGGGTIRRGLLYVGGSNAADGGSASK
jgi:hypothetical protein